MITVGTNECVGVNTNLLALCVSATGRQVVLHYTDCDGQWSGRPISLLDCGWRRSSVCELNGASLGAPFGLQFCNRNNRRFVFGTEDSGVKFFVLKIRAFYFSYRKFRRFIVRTEDSGVLFFVHKIRWFYFSYRRFRRFIFRTEDSGFLFFVQNIRAFYFSYRRLRRFIVHTEYSCVLFYAQKKLPTFRCFIVRTEAFDV